MKYNKPFDKKGRLGIPWLWELPEDHRLTDCAKYHDAAYDVAQELYDIGEKKLAINYIKKADDEFCKCCKEKAKKEKSWFLMIQANIFCKLVHSWRKIKFGE